MEESVGTGWAAAVAIADSMVVAVGLYFGARAALLALAYKCVADIQDEYQVHTLVCSNGKGEEWAPGADTVIAPGSTIAVVGPFDCVQELKQI